MQPSPIGKTLSLLAPSLRCSLVKVWVMKVLLLGDASTAAEGWVLSNRQVRITLGRHALHDLPGVIPLRANARGPRRELRLRQGLDGDRKDDLRRSGSLPGR